MTTPQWGIAFKPTAVTSLSSGGTSRARGSSSDGVYGDLDVSDAVLNFDSLKTITRIRTPNSGQAGGQAFTAYEDDPDSHLFTVIFRADGGVSDDFISYSKRNESLPSVHNNISSNAPQPPSDETQPSGAHVPPPPPDVSSQGLDMHSENWQSRLMAYDGPAGKPWLGGRSRMSDYFNYDYDADSFRALVQQQLEMRMQRLR